MTRTDGDSWDLASSVGATATSVAASRALATRQPDPLINDPYADILVKAVGLDHCNRLADGMLDFSDDGADAAFGKQRMCEQIAVRTRFFDDFLTTATTDGITQVVILAAGLDTRAYRLSWPSATVIYEIDQPQVIDFKARTLDRAGARPAAEHHTVSIDLRDDWPKALRDSGFNPDVPTAWIAEGLLIYLPPDAQDRLLDNITALSAPGSRLATEHMDVAALTGDWADRLTERARRSGSDIDLAALFYSGERNAARDYLGTRGWCTSTLTTREAYDANHFPHPAAELMALTGDSGYLTATLD
jgi:methyltransferase (TIGR00027 family)